MSDVSNSRTIIVKKQIKKIVSTTSKRYLTNRCLLFIQFSQVSLQRKFLVQIRSVN